MAMPLIYIDRSDVLAGAGHQLRQAVSDLTEFVEANQPQLIAYGFSLEPDASSMTVVAVHPDSASLERHLRIGGPEFKKVGAYLTLRSIEVFGDPSDAAVTQLRDKARMLGDAAVVVHPFAAGFGRVGELSRA